jgi:ABC-2 type transport system permease protein
MLGVQAVLLGSNIIAKEETEKTIEFLAVKPVSRNHILFAKLLAAITVIVGLNLTALVSSLITVNMFNDGPSINRDIFFLMPAVFFIQLIFLMVGVSFATIMRRSKRAGLLSAAVLLASFIISVYVDVSDRFEFLRYLTPFQYFDPKVIIGEGAYDWVYILIAAAAVILMTAASRLAYMRRDFSV